MGDRAFDGGMMHEGAMHGAGGGWEIVEGIGAFSALLFSLLLLALVAWAAYRFLPRLRGGRPDRAEDILRERLARGEVSSEEYETTLKTLRSSQPQAQQGAPAQPRTGGSLRSTYEDYVRDAMNRLRLGRNAGGS